jgi:hypothetical protein
MVSGSDQQAGHGPEIRIAPTLTTALGCWSGFPPVPRPAPPPAPYSREWGLSGARHGRLPPDLPPALFFKGAGGLFTGGRALTYIRKETIGDALAKVQFVGFEQPTAAIYGIYGSDGNIAYVGTTTQPIKRRIQAHINVAKRGSNLPIHSWMRGNSFRFSVRLIGRCTVDERIQQEKSKILLLRPPHNVTDGGPGMSGNFFAGTDHAEKIAQKLRQGANCVCQNCGKNFWRKPRDIKLGHNRFCARRCYQAWQRGRPKSNASGLMGVAGRAAVLAKRGAQGE